MKENYRHTKGTIQDNALAALLHDPLFRQRSEKIRKGNKGKCGYNRKHQQGKNWEASGKCIIDTVATGFLVCCRTACGLTFSVAAR